MRTLTSVRSATSVLLDLELHIKASDQSTTWIFDRDQIQSYPKIDWEIDFAGGFGRSSNYDVTLVSSIGFLNTNINKLNRAEAFLKVFVNSDNFTPHYGRVRGFERNASNPDVFKLKVYDNFIDGNVKIPQESIVDSYSTPHPQVLNVDMGYPLYYGKHTRPISFTAVDSNIHTLLGPRNVSSENHVSSLYANISEVEVGYKASWNQQSGSDNLATPYDNNQAFEISPNQYVRKFWEYTVLMEGGTPKEIVTFTNSGWGLGSIAVTTAQTSSGLSIGWDADFSLNVVNQDIVKATRIKWDFRTLDVSTYTAFLDDYRGRLIFQKEQAIGVYAFWAIDSHYAIGQMTVPTSVHLLNPEYINIFRTRFTSGTAASSGSVAFIVGSLSIDLAMNPLSYTNYMVRVNAKSPYDIAISENPNGIVKDLLDQTSFNYIQAQNSTAQLDVSSYNFQCLFSERQPLSDIFQEFGELTGTCYWIQDSGFIGMRTYQESATASNSIDYILRPNDFREDSVVIRDNPIGFIFYQTKKASEIGFQYNYSFFRKQYDSVFQVNRNNNSYCNSAYLAGIRDDAIIKTKYVLETYTASLCLSNYARRLTTDDNIVEASLPARFMGLELADILEIHHPALPNSSDLYQVTKVIPDYETGDVSFTANKIKNL